MKSLKVVMKKKVRNFLNLLDVKRAIPLMVKGKNMLPI